MEKEPSKIISKLTETIPKVRKDLEMLEEDEEKEMKYLERDDLSGSIEIFSKEAELALEISHELKIVEDSEIKLEEIIKQKEGKLPKEVGKEFIKSEKELESLLKKYIEEVEVLKTEAEKLEKSIAESNIQQEKINNFKKSMEQLETSLELLKELKSEKNTILNRREALIAGGGLMASLTSGKVLYDKLNGGDKEKEEVLELERKRAEEINTGKKLIKREKQKPNSQVKENKGRFEEVLKIGQNILIKAEIIRSGAGTAFTRLEVINNSKKSEQVEIGLKLENWAASGVSRYQSGGPYTFYTEENIASNSTFTTAATIGQMEDEKGRLEYEINIGAKEELIGFNIPPDIIEDQTIKNNREIENIDIEYQTRTRSDRETVTISIMNELEANLEASLSFSCPSGWSMSGMSNVRNGTLFLISNTWTLRPRDQQVMEAEIIKNDQDAPKIGSISLTDFPEGEPDKVQDFIIPVYLE